MFDRSCLLLGSLAFALAACSDSDDHDGADAAWSPPGEVPVDPALDAGDTLSAAPTIVPVNNGPGIGDEDASDPSAHRPPPTNVSFETALRIGVDGKAALQDRVGANQIDYFTFTAEAGAFYELKTDFGPFSPDNVLSLYDPDRTLIAQNDNGSLWSSDDIDARLVVRTPKAGDYFVRVEDPKTPPEFFEASAFPLLFYHLTVRKLASDTPGFALAAAGTPPALHFADDPTTHNAYVTVVGAFTAGTDSAFSFAGRANAALIGHVLPMGSMGNGSTAVGGHASVLSSDQHALADADLGNGQYSLHPPVADGTYQVVLHAGATTGVNDFFAADLLLIDDNPREQAEAANNQLSGAEPLSMQGTSRRRGLILASLPAMDIDYYHFDVNMNEHVSVACEGESGGSGVRNLRAELRDGSDQMLASALETSSANLLISKYTVTAAGTLYLRLSSDATAPMNQIEPWVRCVLIAGL